MNLYLVTPNYILGYDCYTAVIVAATSEKEARELHPSGDQKDWDNPPNYRTWVDTPDQVTASFIVVATKESIARVILADFKAV